MADTRYESRARSFSPRLLALAAGLCLLAALPAMAGSIFMKNGYIIQGPIVEHRDGGEGSVVLGWPHGKVTIYRRFIERVDFEPGEELASKAAEAPADPAAVEEVVIAPGAEEELPRDLSELVKAYKLPPSLLDGKVPPPAAAVEPAAPSVTETPETAVHAVPPPVSVPADPGAEPVHPAVPEAVAAQTAAPAGSRWTDPAAGFSLEPPSGWTRTEGPGIVAWSGPVGAEGFAPSLNISSVGAAGMAWKDACQALKEDQAVAVREYRPIGDETVEIAGRPAYRVAGQGATPGEGSGRKVVIRQVILEKGGKYWLISTFVPAEKAVEVAEILDRTVRSFQVDA